MHERYRSFRGIYILLKAGFFGSKRNRFRETKSRSHINLLADLIYDTLPSPLSLFLFESWYSNGPVYVVSRRELLAKIIIHEAAAKSAERSGIQQASNQ